MTTVINLILRMEKKNFNFENARFLIAPIFIYVMRIRKMLISYDTLYSIIYCSKLRCLLNLPPIHDDTQRVTSCVGEPITFLFGG